MIVFAITQARSAFLRYALRKFTNDLRWAKTFGTKKHVERLERHLAWTREQLCNRDLDASS